MKAPKNDRQAHQVIGGGGAMWNVQKLIDSDAITGPYRRTKPFTLTLRRRVMRALRNIVNAIRSPN
jgi:hypothetical protein